MTICIAAICDQGKQIVVAADRMLTVGHPLNVQFEPKLSKMEKLAPSCLALMAGSTLYAGEILGHAKSKLGDGAGINILAVAIEVGNQYTTFRNHKIEEQIINPHLGPDFVLFRDKGGFLPNYLQVQPGIYQNLVLQMAQFNLGVEYIIAGIDGSGSHIYFVGHPGTLVSFDKLGYNSIGTGSTHAAVSFYLGEQTYASPLPQALFSVYDAKRASEVAPGVGSDTEMAVISENGVWICPDGLIEEIQKVHEASIQEFKPDCRSIEKAYGKLRQSA